MPKQNITIGRYISNDHESVCIVGVYTNPQNARYACEQHARKRIKEGIEPSGYYVVTDAVLDRMIPDDYEAFIVGTYWENVEDPDNAHWVTPQ